jgi:hypothetical protein
MIKKRWRWGRTTRGWDEGEEKERTWRMLGKCLSLHK